MNFLKKWYTYQKERFPILMYGLYIFAITFATYCFASFLHVNLNGGIFKIEWKIFFAMFSCAFLQFLMVRIIDEFKDYDEDCKYRPYRPVPRGLITLRELKILFIICATIQICITALVSLNSIILLLILWIFFIVMSKSFFMKKTLEKNILLEVTFDELLMPILVLYLSSFLFKNISFFTSWQLYIFLGMTYVVSWIIEIARKVRCKEDEETGVKTYTAVFGIKKAMFILIFFQMLLVILQTLILGIEKIWITASLFIIVSIIDLLFMVKQNKKISKFTELSANIHVLVVYFSMILLVI